MWRMRSSILFLVLMCSCSVRLTCGTAFCQDVIEPFKNYDCAEHSVWTNDGFGLTLEHVTHKNHQGNYSGEVLFLHTVFLGGEQWFYSANPIPLTVADNNFSVWIANMRTSLYGLGHNHYVSTDMEYWDWCGDEMVNYDFPALVQSLLNAISDRPFHVVGFSHGARVAIGALTYLFQQAQLVASATFIAPVIYCNVTSAPLLRSIKQADITQTAYKTVPSLCLGICAGLIPEFMKDPWLKQFMSAAVTSVTGPNCCTDHKVVFEAFTGNASCTSFKLLDHLYQNMNKGNFQTYEYGSIPRSLQVYGSPYAPIYQISALPGNIPTLVMYGGADTFADPVDVLRLVSEFAASPELHHLSEYAHADFLFSRFLEQDVTQPLLQFIRSHNPGLCDRVKCFSQETIYRSPAGVYVPVFPSSFLSLAQFGIFGIHI